MKKKLYALVHALSKGKSKVTYIVSTDTIKGFSLDEKTYKVPHYAEETDVITGEKILVPVQIHYVSSDYDKVERYSEEKEGRLRYFNLNESGADEQIKLELKRKGKTLNMENLSSQGTSKSKESAKKVNKKKAVKSTVVDSDITNNLLSKLDMIKYNDLDFDSDDAKHAKDKDEIISNLKKELEASKIQREKMAEAYDKKIDKMNNALYDLQSIVASISTKPALLNILPFKGTIIGDVKDPPTFQLRKTESTISNNINNESVSFEKPSSSTGTKAENVIESNTSFLSDIRLAFSDEDIPILNVPLTENIPVPPSATLLDDGTKSQLEEVDSSSSKDRNLTENTSTPSNVASTSTLVITGQFEESRISGLTRSESAFSKEFDNNNQVPTDSCRQRLTFTDKESNERKRKCLSQEKKHRSKKQKIKDIENYLNDNYKVQSDDELPLENNEKSNKNERKKVETKKENEHSKNILGRKKDGHSNGQRGNIRADDKYMDVKREKKMQKKKKSRKSDSEYYSDLYEKENTTGLKDFTKWERSIELKRKNAEEIKNAIPTKITINTYTANIQMIHLRFGVSIPYKSFKIIEKQKEPGKFLKKLAIPIWTQHHLLNQAFVLEKRSGTLEGRSPRKSFTPVKKAVLRKLYFAFIKKRVVSKSDRKNARDDWRAIIGDLISYLIKQWRKGKFRKVTDSGDESDSDSSEEEFSGSSDSDSD